MTDTIAPQATVPTAGLATRLIGVIFSPRTTYAGIAANPRVLGALAVVLLLSAVTSTVFFSTERGKEILLDQAVQTMESFGVQVTDQMYDRIEQGMNRPPYASTAGQIVVVPIVVAVLSGLFIAIFNGALGATASFKQVYAIVTHSGVLFALQQLLSFPMFYVTHSMSSPTSLGVFFQFLDQLSFLSRLLGTIDLFRIWWIVNLAIGIGVLYKKPTRPIAVTLLALYGVVALVIAGVGFALGGGA